MFTKGLGFPGMRQRHHPRRVENERLVPPVDERPFVTAFGTVGLVLGRHRPGHLSHVGCQSVGRPYPPLRAAYQSEAERRRAPAPIPGRRPIAASWATSASWSPPAASFAQALPG